MSFVLASIVSSFSFSSLILPSCFESVACCSFLLRFSWILSCSVMEAVKVPTMVEISVATIKPFLRLFSSIMLE